MVSHIKFAKHQLSIYCVLSIIALFTASGKSLAQTNNQGCAVPSEENYAFQDGEELTYVANYTWGLVSTDVGEATLRINRILNGNTPYYFVDATAKTYKFYDNFFKVRDTYMARFNAQTHKSVYFHRNINEGGYLKKNTLNFDWDNMLLKSTSQRKKNTPTDTTLKLTNSCTFDVLTLLYYARNMDFSFAKEGQSFPLTFAIDEEIYNIKFRYVTKETVELKGQGNFRCLKFAVEVVAGEVFTGKDEITMWVTDDRNHVPLKIESPIVVGTVRALLTSMKNLKHPQTCK